MYVETIISIILLTLKGALMYISSESVFDEPWRVYVTSEWIVWQVVCCRCVSEHECCDSIDRRGV